MGINIKIIAGADVSSSSVQASGTVQHIITDEERTSFKLGDQHLKDAINKYFGKAPDDAFLHSPTPWEDLYKRYSWPEVQVVLVVESAEILGVTSEPVVVKTQEFKNSSNQKGSFNASITETVNNTTSSNWNTGGNLSVGQSLSYGVEFAGTGAKGETSISYSQSWGVGSQESKSITVGSTSGVSVDLAPGESVIAELSASRGVMKVRVKYKAYLTGVSAVNYDESFKDHHFWSMDINAIMNSAGLLNSIKSTEEIEIGYYSNSKIELK